MIFNRPILGFIIGLFAPVVAYFIVFAALHGDQTFSGFSERMMSNHDFAGKVISLSLLGNAIAFVCFNRSKKPFGTARGIVYATLLYAVVIVLLKFVWT